ncbi:N-6 DNA methylase [Bacillus pumilus]|uniref:N-6 DNA methylase n=1 Tax=Bacillus pumilus TaxID=1408 RepID=UPI000D0408AD|nr:N-6 DNA methylase [Bacillus pumilus]PRS27017.1 hypothetical protein C6X99_17230 [Bacillus pumilus]
MTITNVEVNPILIENDPLVQEATLRGFIEIKNDRVTYFLNKKKSYNWIDPEEWVRCRAIAYLIVEKDYSPKRMLTEVSVPKRTPNDFADIVVFEDDKCKSPYLVVENKSAGQTQSGRNQGIEQLFGNANSLRAPFGVYDEYSTSVFFDIGNYASMERKENIKGNIQAIQKNYGEVASYTYIAGEIDVDETALKTVRSKELENRVRRAHSIIWSNGKRDPLTAFDEWSKLLFAKVEDERNTPNGEPYAFQVGTNETSAAVANRIHKIFNQACRSDTTIFPDDIRINLPDTKIFDVVKSLQDITITHLEVDSIGIAFERFFGSVFRGELGQYFTMRQLARFSVAMLDVSHQHYVIDLTAGSGGFLLEVLLQVWNNLDKSFSGRRELWRIKNDFALHKVYGIEIHDILARICKINLLLHHDGHTNIEGDRSCLDTSFMLPRLQNEDHFDRVVGNLPFGDSVSDGDEDLLGENSLENFEVAKGRSSVPSEHIILEKAINLLSDGGELGLILPDGLFNNQGELSNCPALRRYLIKNGEITSIVSLPDYAFRKSGAQNKTSILFFRKFTSEQRKDFNLAYSAKLSEGNDEDTAVLAGLEAINYFTFMAEAKYIGYTSVGAFTELNDLYSGSQGGHLEEDQTGTILGEYRKFVDNPVEYVGAKNPDCMSISIVDVWNAHASKRLDPKYFLFKKEEKDIINNNWVNAKVSDLMARREERIRPETNPTQEVTVMTLTQNGEIKRREAGKGVNPPEWLGMYFEDSSSKWYRARQGDLVFSSIDLWRGCIAVVPEEFDKAIVTKEFPIYEIIDERLDPEFLAMLLRSRFYQRAFKAITTGHSNRRRTQVSDFEALEISFPPNKDAQKQLINDIVEARASQKDSETLLKKAMLNFSDLIDGRGDEEYENVVENSDSE